MTETTDNSLERFERRPTHYTLLALGVGSFLCLAAATVFAAGDGAWSTAMATLIGSFLLIVFVFLSISVNKRARAVNDRKHVKWDASLPELQRQNVNLEVKELARLLGVERDQMGELLSAYIVAEDLALRQMQQEERSPLLRHVQLGSTSFDAVMIQQETITCIDVSFVVVPDIRKEKIESILRKFSQAKRNMAEMKLRLHLKLMLVLVTQLTPDEEDQLREVLVERSFTDTPVDIDIRLLDFESLQKIYVTD